MHDATAVGKGGGDGDTEQVTPEEGGEFPVGVTGENDRELWWMMAVEGGELSTPLEVEERAGFAALMTVEEAGDLDAVMTVAIGEFPGGVTCEGGREVVVVMTVEGGASTTVEAAEEGGGDGAVVSAGGEGADITAKGFG